MLTAVTPSRDAVSRSITSDVCRPLSCVSVLTSSSSGSPVSACRIFGSQVRRSLRSSACSVYWYCALPARPPTRTSCAAWKYSDAPGSRAVFARRRAITASIDSLRSDSGFRPTNMLPELRCPPPVNATTLTTAGSAVTMSAKRCSLTRIAWNEIAWSATTAPPISPVSCCGKKPFGTIV